MSNKSTKKTASKQPTKKMTNAKKVAGVTAGVAGLALAGTTAYLLSGKRGAKNRAKISKTAKSVERKIGQQTSKAKKAVVSTYKKAKGVISEQYDRLQDVDPKDLAEFTGDLKKRWEQIAKEVQTVAKGAQRILPPVKREVKKEVKKVVKIAKKATKVTLRKAPAKKRL